MANNNNKKKIESLFDSKTFQKEIKEKIAVVNKERKDSIKPILITSKDAMLRHLAARIQHQIVTNAVRLAKGNLDMKRIKLCVIDDITTTLSNEELHEVSAVLNEAKEINVYISSIFDVVGDCTMICCEVACNLS